MGPNTQQVGGIAAGSGGEAGEAIVSSGATDGGDGSKLRGSRKLILGVILAVLVLVGGGVGIVIAMNINRNNDNSGGSSNGTSQSIPVNVGEVRSNFNRYVNYLLKGEDSVADVNMDFEYNENYEVVKILSSSKTKRAEYFAELEDKFVNFTNEFDEVFPDMDTGDVISDNYSYLNYLRMHAEAGLEVDEVMEMDENGNEWDVEEYGNLLFDARYVVNNSKNINAILTREGA